MNNKPESGYKKLEIYKLSYELSLKIHKISLSLPKFEMYEEGSQIRRSAKSICANIVEGHALRKYKNEYLHYLYRSYGSSEETRFHLDEIFDSRSLTDQGMYDNLVAGYAKLSAMLFAFIQSVERNYDTPLYLKEEESVYQIKPESITFPNTGLEL